MVKAPYSPYPVAFFSIMLQSIQAQHPVDKQEMEGSSPYLVTIYAPPSS
jgi:hypothetical protein